MAVMNAAKGMRIVYFFICFQFDLRGNTQYVSANVLIGMGNTSVVFECSKPVTLRCDGGSSFINWQIEYQVMPNSDNAAQCVGFKCYEHNNFNGRYNFTYNSTSGISYLRIDPVILEDDRREYKCSDANQLPVKATVKTFPTNTSYEFLNKPTGKENGINFTVNVKCTTDNVSVIWYSTAENGIDDFKTYDATYTHRYPCPDGDCTDSKRSVQISSSLEVETVTNSNARRKRQVQGQKFGVNVSFDSQTFHIPIEGSYILKVNTSTVKPPTPSTVTTPTSSMTVLSTTEHSNDSRDDTYIIIFSCIGSFVFVLVIMIVICCILRKRRQIRKSHGNKHKMQRTHLKVR